MGFRRFLIYHLPRKVLSLVPVRLRSQAKKRILEWMEIIIPVEATVTTQDQAARPVSDKQSNVNEVDAHSMAASLGFPSYTSFSARQDATGAYAIPVAPLDVDFENRVGTVLVSVCTLNYLHYAHTMIASVRKHHGPEEMAIYVLLVDWDGKDPLDLHDAHLFAGCDVGLDRFPYMALKFNAMELCCACKPHFLHYVMAATRCRKVLFIDTDIYIFARLDELLASLDHAPLVVTPHTFTPPPLRNGSHVRPRLKEIIYAGSYNSGLIGMTVVEQNAAFVSRWAAILAAPSSFLDEQDLDGIEQEQQVFNWLVSLAEGVKVLKNPAYNVAYWNLHDRSVRYILWDDIEAAPGWRVDGEPLVAFHFSGFSLRDPRRLSRHDYRYDLFFLPSITMLVEFYVDELTKHGGLAVQAQEYGFNRFPSGLQITTEMRMIFKRHEQFLWSDLDPWSEVGESYFAQRLFLPMMQTASLLPVALYYIYQRRVDLQAAFPHAHLHPEPMISWFAYSGLDEEPQLAEYYNRYRPIVPKRSALPELQQILRKHPDANAGVERPMSQDRSKLVRNLRELGERDAARQIQSSDCEYFALSPIYLIWKFVQQEGWLSAKFPDLLFDDALAFGEWLQQNADGYFLASDLTQHFLKKAQGHSLARVFSFINENYDLAAKWPLLLVGQNKDEVLSVLLGQVQYDPQFDLDDVIMFAWVMESKPWAGLPLTFELLANASREPSPLTKEGQDSLLGPVLEQPGFRDALVSLRASTAARDARRPKRVVSEGANVFGFFKSPIGLGSLSHGLALAFGAANLRAQKNLLSLASMDNDLRPEHFIRMYDDWLDTNVFVSYPHLPYSLLDRYPENVLKGRNNIIYLAWEQRDGYVTWDRDYAGFDQVWALSNFAAQSFRRYMKRDDVLVVPCVVDFDSFPSAVSKADAGLDPERFIFLYVFDAHSSIERKNPEAAIRAFSRAFSTNDKVQLLFKVNNAHRQDCRGRLQRLTDLAVRTGMDIQFIMKNLPRDKVLGLISAIDCYVSLHRAEGFGYTCAEAMAYGRPVIATNYSATTEFIDAEDAFPVHFKECEVTEADGPFHRGSIWAEPDVDHAAWQMRQVYLHQQKAAAIAEVGRSKVRSLFSAETVGRIVAAAITGHAHNEVE